LLVGGTDESGPDQGEVRKLVFERLNTGGQHLNAQELRNCLFAGQFNDLLIELSQGSLFTAIWGIPPRDQHVDRHGNVDEELRKHPLYRRMIDCELVLRFFAFRKRTNVKGSVRAMLDRCMKDNLAAKEDGLKAMADDFKTRLSLAHDIFGEHTFEFQDEKGVWQASHPLYDGVMVALDRLWDHRVKLVQSRARVVEELDRVLRDPGSLEFIIGKPNTAKAVLKRMDLVTKALESAL
jgi:hypothetical protein